MPRSIAPHIRAATAVAALALACGCTPFPEVGAPAVLLSRPVEAPGPRLVPVEGLVEQAATGRIDADTEARLAARAAALRSRGAALRGTPAGG